MTSAKVRFAATSMALKINCFSRSRRRHGVDVMPLSYDDLVEDPSAGVLSRLLDHCGVSPLEGALAAMGEDSQDKSPLSREMPKKFKRSSGFTIEEEEEINSVFVKCGLPPMDEFGTILR